MGGTLPRRRKAIRRILAPAIVIMAVVVVGSASLFSYAGHAVDQLQIADERALVARRIERALAQAVSDITSASVWDQAYENLGPDLDADWADVEIGNYYETYLGHVATVVLDGADAPVYAWRGGGRAAPTDLAALVRDAGPLLAELRSRERADAPGLAGKFAFEAVLTDKGVVRSDGRLYLVGISTVARESAAVPLRPGPAPVIISALPLDATLLSAVHADLRIEGATLTAHRPRATSAVVPIVDVSGREVADLAWSPKRPGLEILRDAFPLLGACVLVLLLAGAALAARIRAVFAELAANDATLDRAMGELVRARDLAQAANVAKSQFLANMSHEIRTPLNGVLGMAQVMARHPLEPAQMERLNVIRDSGETLLIVLNDILDISKIEAGKLEIDNHEFDLDEAVRSACAAFASLAAQKDVDFTIEVDETAHGVWFGDGARLRQVIANLASNAVKFTHSGEVLVRVGAGPGGVRFEVHDTGIGIPADRVADLFQKFSQVDASTTRQFGGTGLGLAICRELVDLMGGELSVASTVGQGSAFTFELPLQKRADAAPQPVAAAAEPVERSGAPLRVLAAEDNPTNQLILRSLLEPLGMELTIAGDGREALEAFTHGAFDLVLMDIQMPRMNGVEATAAIRAVEVLRDLPATPILALSANVMKHQVAEYLDAGMTGFVPKPISAAELRGGGGGAGRGGASERRRRVTAIVR